ncbi:MAG: hypothetical protein IPK69_01725 [Phycisphaerales bacterium]|nr:MAG: hypothetical protein IPK69_01725 [Phycisphaerales bacterium]
MKYVHRAVRFRTEAEQSMTDRVTPWGLMRRVGRALGVSRTGAGSRQTPRFMLEGLEQRTLLEGSFATAVPVLLTNGEGSQGGAITPATPTTDNDFFQFVMPGNPGDTNFVSILADTANETPTSSLNTKVSVFRASDLTTPLATGNTNGILSTGTARDGWAGFIGEAGQTYFVVVSSDTTGAPVGTGTYTLRVRTNSTFVESNPDTGILRDPALFDPAAPDLTAAPTAIIDILQDEAVFKWTVPNDPEFNGLATFNLQSTVANLAQRLDTRLDIYRQTSSNGAITRVAFDSDAGRLNDSFTTLVTVPGEVLWIRVRSDEVRPNLPTSPNGVGRLFLVADGSSNELPDAMSPITRRGSDQGAAFSGFDDPDPALDPAATTPGFQSNVYRFVAQGSGLTIITATPAGLAPVTDPALRLYDSAGNLLAFNDNFSGLSPQLEVQLDGGKTYFVVVDGFQVNNGVQYNLFIESNHTFDPSLGIDDQIDTPAGNTESDLLQASLATALRFNAPFQTFDANGNLVRDVTWQQTAFATGRIHDAGDVDLFQFVPPVDMLGDYQGDNDDAGTSLFVGGRLTRAGGNAALPTVSRGLTVWDGGDWWFTGDQRFDPNNGQLGFVDNPATATTTNPELYTLLDFDPTPGVDTAPEGMTDHILIVGGDFNLVIPTPQGPVTLTNIALWLQDFNTGEFGWAGLNPAITAGITGPVRALSSFTPSAETIDHDLTQRLAIGGGIGNQGFLVMFGDGIDNFTFNGPVNALDEYDPPDPGAGDSGGTPPIPDPSDPPNMLFIGGRFNTVSANGGPVQNTLPFFQELDDEDAVAPFGPNIPFQNIAAYANEGDVMRPVKFGPFANAGPAATVNGGPNPEIFSLTTWDDPGDGVRPAGEVLAIGGLFTTAGTPNFGGTNTSPNIVTFGSVTPEGTPPNEQYLTWNPVGTGTNGAVRALTTWNPPEINGAPADAFRFLVAGGDFTDHDGFIGIWNGGAWQDGFLAGLGALDAPVRTLTTFVDTQEPGVESALISGNPQEALWLGGDFVDITLPDGSVLPVNHVAQVSADTGPFGDFFTYSAMFGGVTNSTAEDYGPTDQADVGDPAEQDATVFVLAPFDDGNPLRWDRHDRPASRLGVVVNPTFGGFENVRIRILDSNLDEVFAFDQTGSNSIALPNPDPAGMINPLTTAGVLPADGLGGIKLWGGEVYYLEVTDLNNSGTGRYNISLTVDAFVPDISVPPDGVRDDSASTTLVEEPNERAFDTSLHITTNLNTGDGSANQGTDAQPAGSTIRTLFTNPFDPSSHTYFGDLGSIQTIDDTDLWNFRAEFTGTVEVRIATRNLTDFFGELDVDLAEGTQDYTVQTKTYNSPLDSAVRIFDNDFSQIVYNNDNNAVSTAYVAPETVGGVGPVTFTRRDARAVFHVVAGNTYFIQVESGQAWIDGSPSPTDENAAARERILDREIDWRRAIGSYQILIHQMTAIPSDLENGQTVQDDHVNRAANNALARATVIPIDDVFGSSTIGTGSVDGVINNTPNNLADTDTYTLIAPGNGTLSITATRTSGTLVPDVTIQDANGNTIANGIIVAPGSTRATVPATTGQRFYVVVGGNGTAEGAYTLSVAGVPPVDDHADEGKWWQATDLDVQDFQGLGSGSGTIEAPGDSDVFRFTSTTFGFHTVTVSATSPGFNPAVQVWEVSEDPAGNAIYQLIAANNDDIAGGTLNARARFSATPDRQILPPQADPARLYPYYYIVVTDADLAAGIGSYNVNLVFTPSDDHPDAPLNGADRDTSQFAVASIVPLDPFTGLGNLAGNVETATDTDLFTFTGTATGDGTVTLTRNAGSLLRARVTVYSDPALGPVTEIVSATMPDDAGANTITLDLTIVRGRNYFVVVEPIEEVGGNVNTAVTGAYTLDIATPPIDDHANATEWNIATQIPINPTSGVGQIGAADFGDAGNPQINYAGDTDLYRFTAIRDGTWSITVTPLSDTAQGLAPTVTIFNSTFTQVTQFVATSALQPASFSFTGLTQGTTYYILVAATTGVSGGTTTGQYNVNVAGPTTGGGGGSDPSVIDFNQPAVLSVNPRNGYAEASDSIDVANDRDLFRFTTGNYSGLQQVFVQVIAPNGSLLDANVRVVNAATEAPTATVGFDDSGLPGVQANLAFLAPGNTTYWIIVDGVGDSVGSYTIRVSTQPAVHRLFYPEGYTTDSTREFIGISNPNAVASTYTINIWYETGTLLTSIPGGTVAANSTTRVTLADALNGRVAGLRTDTPYAIEIVSDQPLSATLSHYDFNGSVGDPFTSELDSTWNFARVERSPGGNLDFIVFYNPATFPINVTLTAYQAGQAPVSISQVWDAQRRGGWAINDIANFPVGTFSVTLTATPVDIANAAIFEGVVASLSHYSLAGNGAAFGALGDQSATIQAVTNLTQGTDSQAEVVIFNPTSVTAQVQITGNYMLAPLTPLSRLVSVPAHSQVVLTGTQLGLVNNQPIGLRFVSSQPVSVLGSDSRRGDADAAAALMTAGTRFLFADGFLNAANAGTSTFDTLTFHNPAGVNVTVNVKLLFSDGGTSLIPITVNARGFAQLRLDQRPELVSSGRTGAFSYGIDATASTQFAMAFSHYDLLLGGGWTTTGTPFGLVNTLAQIG